MSYQYKLLTWLLTRSSRIVAVATSWLVIVYSDRGGSWSWIMIITRCLDLKYAYYHYWQYLYHYNCYYCSFHLCQTRLLYKYFKHWYTSLFMLGFVFSHECCEYCYFVNVLCNTQHLLHIALLSSQLAIFNTFVAAHFLSWGWSHSIYTVLNTAFNHS